MRKHRFARPSAALLVSIAALVIAASGTAFAAGTLVNGDHLIKKNSLSGNRLRNRTVTGSKIKLSTLGTVPSAARASFASSATDATNATNATNAVKATTAGAASAAPIAKVTYVSVAVSFGPSHDGIVGTASCPKGTVVVGGGDSAGDPSYSVIPQAYPVNGTGWRAYFYDGHASTTGTVTAICAPAAATGS